MHRLSFFQQWTSPYDQLGLHGGTVYNESRLFKLRLCNANVAQHNRELTRLSTTAPLTEWFGGSALVAGGR